MTAIAATMQAFFTERLIAQRRASPHTVTAYRDTLRLLLGFAAQRTRTCDPAQTQRPGNRHLPHQHGDRITPLTPGTVTTLRAGLPGRLR